MSTYRQYTINKSVYFISIYPDYFEKSLQRIEENVTQTNLFEQG